MFKNRVNGIDGLRAIAMTMVIAQHCGLLPFGWVGVWLFYVISGYVITHGFILEDIQLTHIPKMTRYLAFLRRRIIRIVPAYFAYILLTLLVYALVNGWFLGNSIIGLLSFTYNWQMILGPIIPEHAWNGIGHLWTLSVEQQFYFLFPLLFLWVLKKWRWRAMLLVVLFGPLIRHFYDVAFVIPNFSSSIGHSAFSIYAASFCHFDAFMLGALLANYEKNLITTKHLPIKIFCAVCFFCSVYAMAYMLINWQMGARGIDVIKNIYSGNLYGQQRQLWVYSAVDLFAFVVMLLTIAKVRGTAWLSNPLLSWVGRVSFGGYLVHILVLWLFGLTIGSGVGELPVHFRVMSFIAILIITIGIASFSFKFYEQPVAKKFKNWATPYRVVN